MNVKFEGYKKEIATKKVAAVGLGISNRPLLRYLAGIGVNITGFDSAPYEKLKSFVDEFMELPNVSFSLGPDYLDNLKGFDIIFKTPAIRPDIEPFTKEIRRGAQLTSEMEVFMRMCNARMIAVTGSDGKTTTTTLIGEILKEQGYKVWVGGNVGMPLFDKLDEIGGGDMVVLELGSFQLQTIKDVGPDIAVITNVSPNHLDFHKVIDEYIWSKQNIYRYQMPSDRLVLNFDNEITRSFAEGAAAEVLWFSRQRKPLNGTYLEDGDLVYYKNGKKEVLFNKNLILLKGMHHVENFMAAITAIHDLVDIESIIRVATTFKGVEHRTEPVEKINEVWYYNDSIGSSPTRTKASLNAFEGKVILITGGYDKKIPYDIMGPLIMEKVKGLVLLGQTGPKIKKAFEKEKERTGKGLEVPVIEVDSIEAAVVKASELAVPGDTVILSPASASYDMFPNFEARGHAFKEAVCKLRK
ncbi:MAG TPA: UDP-N-acetylmuramoyl-L-alanine--D-glutamate ligase [Clostridia bacterium]|nr:UDP-N-acetylmuramoyl-L-alanine--D-glutamate ligase [Clostridia bacterium]